MEVVYRMYSLYPDILQNEFDILVNKEIQYSRDKQLLSYLNDHGVPNFPMSQDDFNSTYPILLNYIFNETLNKHNVQVILVMYFEGEEVMCLCVNKTKNRRYNTFEDAIVDLTKRFS
jgi:hypothetical protein